MKYVITVMVILIACSFSFTTYKPPSDFCVFGFIVKYNIEAGEIIIKVADCDMADQYVRIIYVPNGLGFDAPNMDANQVLPQEMFCNASIQWLFIVHLPTDDEEVNRCKHIVQKAFMDREKRIRVEDDYLIIPGREKETLPEISSMPCLISTRALKTHM